MEKGLRVDEVADKWEVVLAKLLDKLCVLDVACCLLQPDNMLGKGTKIYEKQQFPKVFEEWNTYMDFESKWGWSSPTPAEQSKKLKVSCLMGTSCTNPEVFFSMDSSVALEDGPEAYAPLRVYVHFHDGITKACNITAGRT